MGMNVNRSVRNEPVSTTDQQLTVCNQLIVISSN